MLVVYIFLGIIILFLALGIILIFSTLKINVEKVMLDNISTSRLREKFKLKVQLFLFGKIKILSIKIDKYRTKKINLKEKIKKIETKQLNKQIKIKELTPILKKVKLESIHLDLKLDTQDVILTTLLVYLTTTILSIVLGKTIENYIEEKYQYKIVPLYINRNLVKLDLNCIIKVKMVHIIHILYLIVKKGKVKKYERTSNTRSYGYSYE